LTTDTKTRVHTLAKELQVSSKTIIEKCAKEGIVLKNHMHVLSAGLEATIREWFSEGGRTDAVEESEHVDLNRVRVKRPPRKTKKAAAETAEPAAAAAETIATPEPTEPPAVVTPAAAALAAEAAPETTPTGEVAIAEAPVEPAIPPTATSPPATDAGAAPPRAEPPPSTVARPSAPPRIAPAGPQNVPAPAQLQGPRVVRIEKPDVVMTPRPAARGPGFGPAGPPPIAPAPSTGRPGRGSGPGADALDEEATGPGRRKRPGAAPTASPRHRANPRRSIADSGVLSGELLREWRDRDLIERRERLDHASGRGISGLRADEGRRVPGAPPRPSPRRPQQVQLQEPLILREFCSATGVPFSNVFRKLQESGTLVTLNDAIDAETAQLIALEFGLELEILKARSALDRLREEAAARSRTHLASRPPIVTVLGHVDHGKTSLLDRIRRTKVAAGEAGGITQHIGAYRVKIGERAVAFLDTPGHEAFTAMRARGAQMTDVVVLVVAADDGVMPQTIEAISHARAAQVPIVVALNKIDLPSADVNKIYGQLAEQQLVPQEWGGDTDVIKTSAVTGAGVDDLLSHLAALADLLDLKADPAVPASGLVIEAQRDERLGTLARVMVQEGTLKPGAVVVCGPGFGRIRALRDERGQRVREAGPSTPVEVLGLDDVPEAGDRFYVLDDLSQAKEVAEEVRQERRAAAQVRVAKPRTLESVLASRAGGEVPELNVVIRADVQGSVDVLKKTLSEIPTTEVKLNILHAAVGNVTESDVALAQASGAIIIGFHVVPDPAVERAADDAGVDIRQHRVIYDVTDEIRKALAGLLAPTEKIESRGRAEVREIFTVSRVGKVAGCMVRDGVIARNHQVRIVRDGVPIKEGAALASLRRFKDDVREVRAGLECGMRVEDYDDIKPGDVIEAYEVTRIERTLDG